MAITLFTSRVVLDKLGIEDYGIYNVVGGLASMFIFFQSSLANATQRFLNVELGKTTLKVLMMFLPAPHLIFSSVSHHYFLGGNNRIMVCL